MPLLFLSFFVAMTTVVSASLSGYGYNADFCSQHIGVIEDDGSTKSPPVFVDDFYVFVEQKLLDNHSVSYIEEYFSQHSGLVHASLNSQDDSINYWVDTNHDEIIIVPQGQLCTDKTYDFVGTDQYTMIGVTIGPHDSLDLNSPEAFFHWGAQGRENISYKGPDVSRGIATIKWWTCEYDEYRDATTFTEWQIVDPTKYRMPAIDSGERTNPVLPISAVVTGVANHFQGNQTYFNYRYDFASFKRIQPDDDNFRIPANTLCLVKPQLDTPLPSMPGYFKFRGEQVVQVSTESQTPNPADMTLTVEEYKKDIGLYIQDVISTPVTVSADNDKSFIKRVDDFNTGLTYELDLESGECQVKVIDGNSVDAINMGNGVVQMKNSDDFFDLDPMSYQFMGLHEHRGIMCKVWTAFFGPDQTSRPRYSLFSWYFADQDWMTSNGFRSPTVMPVALEVTVGDKYTQFNIFEWATDEQEDHLDLSTCFDPKSTMNIEVHFNARYDQFYTPAKLGFRKGLTQSLFKFTNLKSTLRIADLDVQPGDGNIIVARFKLLDKLNITGDVVNITKPVPSAVIHQQMVTSVNAGSFSVNLGGKEKSVIYAKRNSVTVVTPSRYVTSGQGYSPGVMAGVGIGTLVAGLLIGAVLVLSLKKLRIIGNKEDVPLTQLNPAET
ncbi:unnamed protein product [Lymnaea stagnalis]|uniref:Uncharacterized protein n=1 Tax=Lymnaea stagnalis TaxID=6523 RepID=A0AAV2H3S4_LYMST